MQLTIHNTAPTQARHKHAQAARAQTTQRAYNTHTERATFAKTV